MSPLAQALVIIVLAVVGCASAYWMAQDQNRRRRQ